MRIDIRGLCKSFGKLEVLRSVDLDLDHHGKVVALLGPNGSGKTTLLKCMMSIVLPTAGTITVSGENAIKSIHFRRQVGYLPQIARFPDNLTISELLRWIKEVRGGLADEAPYVQKFELKSYLHKKLGTLSGGTRQKVNLMLAFMHDCPVIVLDEPTVGLDPVAMIALRKIIREEKSQGKMILLSTHIMDFVDEMADHIIYLLDGQIHYHGSIDRMRLEYGSHKLEEIIVKILRPGSHTEDGVVRGLSSNR